MRLIDADELMATLRHNCYPVQHDMTSIEPGMTLMGMLQAIQEQPTIEPQRWIPCSERLPEEIPYYYLVTVANHGTFFTTTFPNEVAVVKWDYDRRKGRGSFHWCEERTVTAWKPMPEPYKGDR